MMASGQNGKVWSASTSFAFGDDDKVFKFGLRTSKRYARVTITPAANSGNAFIAGVSILGHPRNAPTPNPPG